MEVFYSAPQLLFIYLKDFLAQPFLGQGTLEEMNTHTHLSSAFGT